MPEAGQAGARVARRCCKYAVSDAACSDGKARCARRSVSELQRLKALEEETRRLKHVVADQALDIPALAEGPR